MITFNSIILLNVIVVSSRDLFNAFHNSFRLFGFDVQGRDCGEDAAQWITAYLKSEPYRLVCFEPNMVPRNSKDLMEPFRPTDKVSFCQWYVTYKWLCFSTHILFYHVLKTI